MLIYCKEHGFQYPEDVAGCPFCLIKDDPFSINKSGDYETPKTSGLCKGCWNHSMSGCRFFASHGKVAVIKCRWEVMITEEERILKKLF